MVKNAGHTHDSTPHLATSCLSVTEETMNSWSREEFEANHRNYDIHVIPTNPVVKGFNVETCEDLGINVYQLREVHGRKQTVGIIKQMI